VFANAIDDERSRDGEKATERGAAAFPLEIRRGFGQNHLSPQANVVRR
jgi:hypothetical protein